MRNFLKCFIFYCGGKPAVAASPPWGGKPAAALRGPSFLGPPQRAQVKPPTLRAFRAIRAAGGRGENGVRF